MDRNIQNLITGQTNYHYLLLWGFSTPALANGLPLEFKWQQVSRTLLSILTDLNNTAVWMVFTHSLISKSSSPFTNPLMIVPTSSITIGITVIFLFHSFFSSLGLGTYLAFCFLSILFCGGLLGQQSPLFFFSSLNRNSYLKPYK